MRVNCYNACDTELSNLEYGDTFYLRSVLYLKVMPQTSDGAIWCREDLRSPNTIFAVDLSTGALVALLADTAVTKADVMVVANE